MNEQSEKELKMLIEKRWDPRRGVGKMLGTIRYGLVVSFGALIIIEFFIPIPGLYYLPVPGLIFCWLLPRGIRMRTRARTITSDWFLCPWCRYSLVGLEDQGVCPECGAGYRRDVCVSLYQCAYKAYQPDAVTLKKRESKLWREAIELRDGGNDSEGATP